MPSSCLQRSIYHRFSNCELKQTCYTYLQWSSHWREILRGMHVNRRRTIRKVVTRTVSSERCCCVSHLGVFHDVKQERLSVVTWAVLNVFLSALKHTLLGWRCYEGQSTEWTVLSKTPVHSTTSRYSANRLLVHCRGNPYFDVCRYTVVSWPQKSNAQTECSVIKATHSLLCNATAIGGWDTSTRAAFECADGQVA